MQNKIFLFIYFLFLLLLLLGIPNANALEVIHWSIFDATNPQTAISCKKLTEPTSGNFMLSNSRTTNCSNRFNQEWRLLQNLVWQRDYLPV